MHSASDSAGKWQADGVMSNRRNCRPVGTAANADHTPNIQFRPVTRRIADVASLLPQGSNVHSQGSNVHSQGSNAGSEVGPQMNLSDFQSLQNSHKCGID